MPLGRLVPVFAAISLSLAPGSAGAELTPWDQAKVTGIANQLVSAAQDLYDTFYKQPVPTIGSGQARSYQRLKQKIRGIRTQAKQLAGDLEKGEGLEATLPAYEDVMQMVHSARDDARKVFTTKDVEEKATAVRERLNALGPYYDPNYEALKPVTR
jgi:hypothetical protein